MRIISGRPRRLLLSAIVMLGAALGWSSPSSARVERLVVDHTSTATYTPVGGTPTSYTIYSGRVSERTVIIRE